MISSSRILKRIQGGRENLSVEHTLQKISMNRHVHTCICSIVFFLMEGGGRTYPKVLDKSRQTQTTFQKHEKILISGWKGWEIARRTQNVNLTVHFLSFSSIYYMFPNQWKGKLHVNSLPYNHVNFKDSIFCEKKFAPPPPSFQMLRL